MGAKIADLLTHNGETHSLAQWCRIKGMGVNTLKSRIDSGMSVADALETPVKQQHRRKQERKSDANCVDCRFCMELHWEGKYYACDYMGMTGKRRPCEAGDGCKVKEKGERKRISPKGEMVIT